MNITAYNANLLNQFFWCVDFTPPDHGKKKIFIAVGAIFSLGLCLILIIVVIAWWNGYLGGRTSREEGIINLLPNFL